VQSTPEEQIDKAFGTIKSALRTELLQRILQNTPTFFEELIIDLLVKMGYGGSRPLLLCAQTHVPVAPVLPDRNLTPGDADAALTKEVICNKSWSTHEVRNVPEAEKKQVYERYRLQGDNTGYCAGPGGCEIDHLISLELGGKNTVQNLWPQSYSGLPWNAHVKDALEEHLHKLVCDGTVTLQTAQNEIKTDWIKAYEKYVGSKPK